MRGPPGIGKSTRALEIRSDRLAGSGGLSRPKGSMQLCSICAVCLNGFHEIILGPQYILRSYMDALGRGF